MVKELSDSSENFTKCLDTLEEAQDAEWDMINKWAETKGEDETIRFLQAGCKKYGKFMHKLIKKINEEYRNISIEKGPFETLDQNVIPELTSGCESVDLDNEVTDSLCLLQGRQLCTDESIYCTGATGISSANLTYLSISFFIFTFYLMIQSISILFYSLYQIDY